MITYVDKIDGFQNFKMDTDFPLIIKGGIQSWPALRKWKPEFFETVHGDKVVNVSQYKTNPNEKARDKKKLTVSGFFKNLRDCEFQDDYIAGWHFLKNAPDLMNDISIPDPFKENILDRINKEIINYDSISLFIGHSKVETPLHTDSFGVCVWLGAVQGKKIIRLVPPLSLEHVYNGLDVFDESNVKNLTLKSIPVLEAVIEPGDVLFIPSGFWHQVRNEGFTVAISSNFVSVNNFLVFEQQLKAKILTPYLNLLKIKRELLMKDSTLTSSISFFEHFNYLENEQLFLDYFTKQIELDSNIIKKIKANMLLKRDYSNDKTSDRQ